MGNKVESVCPPHNICNFISFENLFPNVSPHLLLLSYLREFNIYSTFFLFCFESNCRSELQTLHGNFKFILLVDEYSWNPGVIFPRGTVKNILSDIILCSFRMNRHEKWKFKCFIKIWKLSYHPAAYNSNSLIKHCSWNNQIFSNNQKFSENINLTLFHLALFIKTNHFLCV